MWFGKLLKMVLAVLEYNIIPRGNEMILHLGPIHEVFKSAAKNLSVKHLHVGPEATVQRFLSHYFKCFKSLILDGLCLPFVFSHISKKYCFLHND